MSNPTRVVIITGPGFQDHDVVYTYYRSKEEGYDISIATKDGSAVIGKYGITVPMDKNPKTILILINSTPLILMLLFSLAVMKRLIEFAKIRELKIF